MCILFEPSSSPYLIVLPIDEDELKVFNRERHDNIISVLPYFMSVVLISLPFAVILPIIFASIFYWMSGLRPEWDSFLWFTLTVGYRQKGN